MIEHKSILDGFKTKIIGALYKINAIVKNNTKPDYIRKETMYEKSYYEDLVKHTLKMSVLDYLSIYNERCSQSMSFYDSHGTKLVELWGFERTPSAFFKLERKLKRKNIELDDFLHRTINAAYTTSGRYSEVRIYLDR